VDAKRKGLRTSSGLFQQNYPFVTTGGGALPLPTPVPQPAMLTRLHDADRHGGDVEAKAVPGLFESVGFPAGSE
jgi:hypothetical protein